MKDHVLESVVERAKQGDVYALGELYELFFDKIYRYALASLGRRQDAEDVASRTFLRMVEAIEGFVWRGGGFSAWLFRIAHNAVMDQFRRGRHDGESQRELAETIAGGSDPGETAEQDADLRELLGKLRELTAEQRQVLLLRFIGGASTREVAEIMGKTEANIRTIQHRALLALRSRLQVKIGDLGH